jgi:hypothetical protein
MCASVHELRKHSTKRLRLTQKAVTMRCFSGLPGLSILPLRLTNSSHRPRVALGALRLRRRDRPQFPRTVETRASHNRHSIQIGVSQGSPRRPAAVTLFNLYNGGRDACRTMARIYIIGFERSNTVGAFGSLRQDVGATKKPDADSRQGGLDCFSQDSATASIHARLIRRGPSRTVGSNTTIVTIPSQSLLTCVHQLPCYLQPRVWLI